MEFIYILNNSLNLNMLLRLMLFYFLITYASFVFTFNTSYIAATAHLDATRSGFIISLFFLAIMAPGFMLNAIIRWLGSAVNLWSLIVMGAGLLLMSLPHPSFAKLATGAILTGLGYGVMQPIIYDKAATNSPPKEATNYTISAGSCIGTLSLSVVLRCKVKKTFRIYATIGQNNFIFCIFVYSLGVCLPVFGAPAVEN